MPLFSWPKWSHYTSTQGEASSQRDPEDRPSHDLIRKLLWHVHYRECSPRMLELEHKLGHSTVEHLYFQRYPRWWTFIPTSELDQLELLCDRIPASHAAAVLSRFREVLANSKVMPWEVVPVFKLVLRDIDQRKRGEKHNLSKQLQHLPTMDFWTSNNKLEHHGVKACSSDVKLREEIPTVSGYVDRAMRCTSLLTPKREWEIPFYYPVPMTSTEPYNLPSGHCTE